MGKRDLFVIHYNPNRPNQTLYAGYLEEGLERLGLPFSSNKNPAKESAFTRGVNICIGPNFALKQCLQADGRTIYIDRCLWGDDLDFVTVGWLNKSGGMTYPKNAPDDRTRPHLDKWKKPRQHPSYLLCCDYGPYPDVIYKQLKSMAETKLRPHPATGANLPPLADEIKKHDIVVGYRTSALFTAICLGRPVICLDSRNAVYPVASADIMAPEMPDRTQWLQNMSYAQWSGIEIMTGTALDYVINHHNPATGTADNPRRSQESPEHPGGESST